MIDLTKRLRSTVPSIPAMRDAADEIEKLRACYATATTELDRLRQEHAAQLAELAAISGALGTNEGHSSVTLIHRLRAEIEALKAACRDAHTAEAEAMAVLLGCEERVERQAAEIERLRAERDEYREAARTWENEAERRSRRYEACVDERDKLHDVLLSWDALIAYQFTGSRDAMNALQQCADETQAVLGTNEQGEE